MRGRKDAERYIPAVVVKADRVWVELKAAQGGDWHTWRMRRDTQDKGTRYPGSNASFLTMDQHAWDKTRNWALAVLKDNGIDLRMNSPWRGREVELADILVTATDRTEAL